MIGYSKEPEGNDTFYISDYIRRDSMFWLLFIFIVLVVATGKWRGISSLVGLGISFLTIFKFILLNIYVGHDSVFIAIAGSLFIIPIPFFFLMD